MLHKLAENLVRRYWYTQAHFQQEMLKLHSDELWEAAIYMARSFGKETARAAVSDAGEPSIFTADGTNLEKVALSGTNAAITALVNYLELAHNCLIKRNHPDLLLLRPRIEETFRRFIADKLAPGGELRPAIEEPAAEEDGYFPVPEATMINEPIAQTGDPARDAYMLGVMVCDGDDARALMRKLIAYVKTDPLLAPEFAVEMVTRMAARQVNAAKTKQRLDEMAEAIHIRTRFIFSPSRQGGIAPVRLFLDEQLFASQEQKQRLERWATQNTDGIFRILRTGDDFADLQDICSGREVTVRNEQMLGKLAAGTFIRARVLPWNDHWLVGGTVQIIDPEAANETAFRETLHPLRVRRAADEKDPRLLAAREYIKIIHSEFVQRFGGELATFESLGACRKALADLHHHLVVTLELSDGRQFADAWRTDTGIVFPPFIEEDFAAREMNLTSPGIVYDSVHGMAFLPNAGELQHAMTDPAPTPQQKEAFVRLVMQRWRPGWVISKLAHDYPQRVQELVREMVGDDSFNMATDLEPLLGRLKCPDHTLPPRPVPFLVS